MFLTDFVQKVARVSKALTTKSPAYGHDYRFEAAHHPDRYRGQHRVDYETCIGCDSCNKICPVSAITMKHLPFKKQNIVPEVNLSVCIFCGLCEDVCPTKPEKSIVLSGGRYDMLTGGWHEEQDDFWVHVNIPEEYIKSRLEAEEAARVAKEMKQKKREAEKRKAEAAAAASATASEEQAKPTDSSEQLAVSSEQGAESPVPNEKESQNEKSADSTSESDEQKDAEADSSALNAQRSTPDSQTTNDKRPTTRKNRKKGGRK